MKCILKACPWAKDGCCKSLGRCGGAHALARARLPAGYHVASMVDNRTIEALRAAGMVRVRDEDGRIIVRAAEAVREAAE